MKYRALLLLITVALISAFLSLNLHSQKPPRTYVGSAACGDCHVPIYQRWAKTRMANVVTDPRARPQVVIPDFSKADPLLTFKLDDVALVYGTKWKQRYFKKVGDDYFPLSAQWDVNHKIWRPYFVQPNTDWWVPYYPADNMKRPTGPLCDGCHSVNYDINTKAVTEWNVGCERRSARECNYRCANQQHLFHDSHPHLHGTTFSRRRFSDTPD